MSCDFLIRNKMWVWRIHKLRTDDLVWQCIKQDTKLYLYISIYIWYIAFKKAPFNCLVCMLFFQESIVSSSAAEGTPTRSLLENQESQQLFSAGYEGTSPSTLPHTSPQPSQQTSSLRKAAKRKRWGSDDGIQNQFTQLEKRKAQLEQNLFTSDEESARFGQTVADMLRRVPEEHRPQAMFDVYKLLFERQQLYRLTAKNV